MEVKKQAESVKEKELFTGIQSFIVPAINPTLDELVALGGYSKEEPVYVGEKDGVDTVRIDVYLQNTEVGILTKRSFFLENKDETSSKGNVRIVNDVMQSTWSKDISTLQANENMTWFKTDTARLAKQGEIELLEFVHKWLGLSYGNSEKGVDADVCKLNLAKLFKGDFSELKSFIKPCLSGGNGIKYLCGVTNKDGKYYQTVYGKYPMLPSVRNYNKLTTELNSEYGEFKADYQNSFDFQPYVIGLVKPDKFMGVEQEVKKDTSSLPF